MKFRKSRGSGWPGQLRLIVVPCDLDDANLFVERFHRHHDPVAGHKFSLAVTDTDGQVRGVGIVGRPINRVLDNGWTLEVLRVATDGTPNACSALYAAAWRATRALGYRKLVTYILQSEPGTSLLAAGWDPALVAEVKGRDWNCPSRPRVRTRPMEDKWRWEISA